MNRRTVIATLAGLLLAPAAHAQKKLSVVTSTTDLHDIAHAVGGNRINTAEQHLQLFGEHVKRVFFAHEVGDVVGDRMSNTCVIFSVRK